MLPKIFKKIVSGQVVTITKVIVILILLITHKKLLSFRLKTHRKLNPLMYVYLHHSTCNPFK